MLTLPEKVLFALAALATLVAAWRAVQRLSRIIGRGQGQVDWNLAWRRLGIALAKTVSMEPVFRFRFWPSLFHAFVAWGFMYYVLINTGDVLQAYLPGFHFLGTGLLGNLYRLGGDLLSVAVLVGMVALTIRRFLFRPAALSTRETTLLHPKARFGIQRDSAIVAGFIILHVGSRFLGESFAIAAESTDAWQPFASAVATWWQTWPSSSLTLARHVTFWLALGSILAFIPYFPYSKHIHLFFAPLNFLLKPEHRSIGELDKLDFEDESIEQFGATRLEDLAWYQIQDAYACIMCFRCQEVCPAYNTGKVLSPAALEINKRYFLNYEGDRLARGEASEKTLVEFAITEEAVWACTACGACVEVCPVGNNPMRDIMEIRRGLVLMEGQFPDLLQTAFRGMERSFNPWNVPPAQRMEWAEGLEIPTIEENPTPELLWWVGCAPATDVRARKVARAFAKILNAAGVNYAVLGRQEQCTGDSARRAGNEYLFYELAMANVELLNEVNPPRIVTLCPHCLHTLKNEYPAFGGHYEVIHHTQLIQELIAAGRLPLVEEEGDTGPVTFHDPCYLGRHNLVFAAPREVLDRSQVRRVEMPHHGAFSFCCGAGGAQMWKEEEAGDERVSIRRMREAKATGAETVAVGCPFCMIMLEDAATQMEGAPQVLDVAEIVAARLR